VVAAVVVSAGSSFLPQAIAVDASIKKRQYQGQNAYCVFFMVVVLRAYIADKPSIA
jgi:hypothetical protein